MLDPAINHLFLKMKTELKETKEKLESATSELAAWKFTPDSQTGKKLMARVRTLIEENQELGKQLSSGNLALLESKLQLQVSLMRYFEIYHLSVFNSLMKQSIGTFFSII